MSVVAQAEVFEKTCDECGTRLLFGADDIDFNRYVQAGYVECCVCRATTPVASGTLVTIEAESLARLERIREAAARWDAVTRKFWDHRPITEPHSGAPSRAEVVRAEQELRAALRA